MADIGRSPNRGEIVVTRSVHGSMNGPVPFLRLGKVRGVPLGRGLAIELVPHGASAMAPVVRATVVAVSRPGTVGRRRAG